MAEWNALPSYDPNQLELPLGIRPLDSVRREILNKKVRGHEYWRIAQALATSSLSTTALKNLPNFVGTQVLRHPTTQRRVPGYYDPRTKEVGIETPSIRLPDMLQHIAVHEAAHHFHRVLQGRQFNPRTSEVSREAYAEGVAIANTGNRRASDYQRPGRWGAKQVEYEQHRDYAHEHGTPYQEEPHAPIQETLF